MSPQQALAGYPLAAAATPLGQVQYRDSGATAPVTHVLLHGIGSASASWAYQLAAAHQAGLRVLAWDAPGYGLSTPVVPEHPRAQDYATRLWAWLDTLAVEGPVTLVGHSLGALMVASAAVMRPVAVKQLVLLSPAQGYGAATEAERAKKLEDRLATLNRLGPHGMAKARGAAMLSPTAEADLVSAVQDTMAQVNPVGYAQAARMLATGQLLADLSLVTCPVTVACGSADTITPPEGCRRVAQHLGLPLVDLGAAGHACPLEAAGAVNRLLGLSNPTDQGR